MNGFIKQRLHIRINPFFHPEGNNDMCNCCCCCTCQTSLKLKALHLIGWWSGLRHYIDHEVLCMRRVLNVIGHCVVVYHKGPDSLTATAALKRFIFLIGLTPTSDFIAIRFISVACTGGKDTHTHIQTDTRTHRGESQEQIPLKDYWFIARWLTCPESIWWRLQYRRTPSHVHT